MLLDRFKANVNKIHPATFRENTTWLLAVSGGVDSVVLCDLASRSFIDFVIVHCNFQLRGEESLRDEAFVNNLGLKYNKQVFVQRFDTLAYSEANKKSIQVAARDLRYALFYQFIGSTSNTPLAGNFNKENDQNFEEIDIDKRPSLIVTAHHANDSIETLLMNFLKGTGITGMHGILPLQNNIFRPLLPFLKEDLLDYAREHSLNYVEDSSNLTDKYSRNYLRQHVMPLLKNMYPQVESNLLANINRFKEVEEVYNQSIFKHKQKLIELKDNEVHIPVLKLKFSQPLHTIIYEIIKDYNFSPKQVDDVASLLESENGKYVSSSTHRIIRNRKWLIISPKETGEAVTILIDEPIDNVLFAQGSLSLKNHVIDSSFLIPTSPFAACLDSADITFPLLLRRWKQGDYFYPLGMKKKKKLSRFFIDNKLSKPAKEKIWVIEANKKIVWVIGQRIDDRFKLNPSTKNALIVTYTP